MGLLKTLFILLLIYYGLKFLTKLFAPFLMKKVVNKMQQKAEQYKNQQQGFSKPNVKEGETIIDKAPNKTKQSKDSVGDYVDFEEID
jgi:hypothetical protein